MTVRMLTHVYYQQLLQPLPGPCFCGENLEYDAGFLMLQARLQPRLNAEYGSFIEAAEPVNWTETERDCLMLLQRSKDIRLVVILIRCRIRQIGVAALEQGLQALHSLLMAYPAEIYPQLVEDGEYDPLMRANALLELEDSGGLLKDLRNQTLPKAAGLQLMIKDFEKAYASPREEGALPEATAAALRQEWEMRQDEAILSLQNAGQHLNALQHLLQASLGDDAPDFSRLSAVLNLFTRKPDPSFSPPVLPGQAASFPAQQDEDMDRSFIAPGAGENLPATAASSSIQKGISSRQEALVKMREIRQWFMRMEPSSPVSVLLEFAELATGKSFPELLKILPPDVIARLDPGKE